MKKMRRTHKRYRNLCLTKRFKSTFRFDEAFFMSFWCTSERLFTGHFSVVSLEALSLYFKAFERIYRGLRNSELACHYKISPFSVFQRIWKLCIGLWCSKALTMSLLKSIWKVFSASFYCSSESLGLHTVKSFIFPACVWRKTCFNSNKTLAAFEKSWERDRQREGVESIPVYFFCTSVELVSSFCTIFLLIP